MDTQTNIKLDTRNKSIQIESEKAIGSFTCNRNWIDKVDAGIA